MGFLHTQAASRRFITIVSGCRKFLNSFKTTPFELKALNCDDVAFTDIICKHRVDYIPDLTNSSYNHDNYHHVEYRVR